MEKVNKMRSGGMKLSNILPQEVVRDLDLAKLFNGTYSHKVEREESSKSRALSIYYDGASWTFGYRIMTINYGLGVPPTLKNHKITVNLNENVGATYPVFDIKKLFKVLSDEDTEDLPPPDFMKAKIKVSLLDENWKVGRVLFEGPHFRFIWRVNSDVNGTKYLSHHGVVQLKTNDHYIDHLLNSMRFVEGKDEIKIKGPSEELKEKQIDEDIELNEINLIDPEKYFAWEVIIEGALNDFWKIVPDEDDEETEHEDPSDLEEL